jgi:hypothetical protein
MIKIERYKNTRHWAVWKDDMLVAVVCYKKGAAAIKQLLSDGPGGQAIENLFRHTLKADLGVIERLARTLNQRIAKTVNQLDHPPR